MNATKSLLLLMAAVMLLLIGACGPKEASSVQTGAASPDAKEQTPLAASETRKDGQKNPVVTIEMNTGDKIQIRLLPDVAPDTVNNFISLVKQGFYDGLIFHRVIPGFMIQGGDPEGTGMGGPGYSIKGEFAANGFTNDLLHRRGVVSMARSKDPDSAGSQFFIMTADAAYLDGQYAAFGVVISGMETVDAIVNQKRDASDKPLDPMSMAKVTVDTFGVEYPEPDKTGQ
ncbi:peptidylprolyl isomerase [Paenibacillus thailandensis]|uniref:Peptidyl-prolyl cis-trans isomerase n=1 Tax=Paenibacillus thailandensis TaxID=393250 RepID=A0ABW5QYH2_9BACL